MRKLKIYLDTSVISHLKQDDVPEKMHDTLMLWEDMKSGLYEVIISDVTIEELQKCAEPKLSYMFTKLSDLSYIQAIETDESLNLAKNYLHYGVLSPKCLNDCRHMAIATFCECDIIVSWNFKHFVNIKTIAKVQAVNKLLGYKEINIFPPTMMVESEA